MKAMKAMKVMKKKAAMKPMKAMKVMKKAARKAMKVMKAMKGLTAKQLSTLGELQKFTCAGQCLWDAAELLQPDGCTIKGCKICNEERSRQLGLQVGEQKIKDAKILKEKIQKIKTEFCEKQAAMKAMAPMKVMKVMKKKAAMKAMKVQKIPTKVPGPLTTTMQAMSAKKLSMLVELQQLITVADVCLWTAASQLQPDGCTIKLCQICEKEREQKSRQVDKKADKILQAKIDKVTAVHYQKQKKKLDAMTQKAMKVMKKKEAMKVMKKKAAMKAMKGQKVLKVLAGPQPQTLTWFTNQVIMKANAAKKPDPAKVMKVMKKTLPMKTLMKKNEAAMKGLGC
jgi:hypothetical protein